MEFPISRHRLQTIAKEFEEAQTQTFINDLIDHIKTLIIVKAYTDSPEKAPPYGTISLGPAQTDKTHTLKLTLPFAEPPSENYISNKNLYKRAFIPRAHHYKNVYLPIILERLSELFPDVSFQVDPLKTYLLIDWS